MRPKLRRMNLWSDMLGGWSISLIPTGAVLQRTSGVQAAELEKQGEDAKQAAAVIDAEVPFICQYFIVDDLNFLRRTGRVSGMTARIGTVLNVKPILYGNSDGHIVACGKARGAERP
jgi:fatty acid-binding protein DegV